jgi:hypothetical protein
LYEQFGGMTPCLMVSPQPLRALEATGKFVWKIDVLEMLEEQVAGYLDHRWEVRVVRSLPDNKFVLTMIDDVGRVGEASLVNVIKL